MSLETKDLAGLSNLTVAASEIGVASKRSPWRKQGTGGFVLVGNASTVSLGAGELF